MGTHLRTPNGPHIAKISRVSIYAQEGRAYHFKLGRGKKNQLYVTSQRFIVFEVEHEEAHKERFAQCEFSIEERWTDYADGAPLERPKDHTIKLASKEFRYGWNNSGNINHEQYLLIRAFDTASHDVAMDIYYKLYHELIETPEIKNYFEDVNHAPGFLETWVPEYLEYHIKIILQDRERQVKEVHDA